MLLRKSILIIWIATLYSCSSTKSGSNARLKEHFVVSVREIHKSNYDNKIPDYYFLVHISYENLNKILSDSYASRYAFYNKLDTIGFARCILNYWPEYWSNSCNRRRITHSAISMEDSLINSAIIKKVEDPTNYSFFRMNIDTTSQLLKIGVVAGVSKLDSLSYCSIFERGFCVLPTDTIVLLKPGFRMSKVEF